MSLGREPRVRRHGRSRQDPRPLQRHRHLHRQGHRLPAVEVRSAARVDGPGTTSATVQFSTLGAARARGSGDIRDRREPPDSYHVRPWRAAADRCIRQRPAGLQRDRRPPVLPAEGGQGGGARPRPPRCRRELGPFLLRDGGVDAGAVRRSRTRTESLLRSDDEAMAKTYIEMSGRRGHRRQGGRVSRRLDRCGRGFDRRAPRWRRRTGRCRRPCARRLRSGRCAI